MMTTGTSSWKSGNCAREENNWFPNSQHAIIPTNFHFIQVMQESFSRDTVLAENAKAEPLLGVHIDLQIILLHALS